MVRPSSRQREIKDANNSSKIHVFIEAGGNGFWLFFGENSFSGGVGRENNPANEKLQILLQINIQNVV